VVELDPAETDGDVERPAGLAYLAAGERIFPVGEPVADNVDSQELRLGNGFQSGGAVYHDAGFIREETRPARQSGLQGPDTKW